MASSAASDRQQQDGPLAALQLELLPAAFGCEQRMVHVVSRLSGAASLPRSDVGDPGPCPGAHDSERAAVGGAESTRRRPDPDNPCGGCPDAQRPRPARQDPGPQVASTRDGQTRLAK